VTIAGPGIGRTETLALAAATALRPSAGDGRTRRRPPSGRSAAWTSSSRTRASSGTKTIAEIGEAGLGVTDRDEPHGAFRAGGRVLATVLPVDGGLEILYGPEPREHDRDPVEEEDTMSPEASATAEPVIKLAYLARRNPALTVEEFALRWRQHSLLAGSMPSIRPGVVQTAHCLNHYDRTLFARATLEYDGVNFLTLTSADIALSMWQSDEALELLQPDELATFSTYARHFTLTTHEHLASPGPMRHHNLIFFLKRDHRTSPADFTATLVEAQAEVAGGRRAVVNVVVDRQPGYNFDAVTELWFDSPDELRDVAGSPVFADTYLGRRAEICDEMRTVAMTTRLSHARPAISEQTAVDRPVRATATAMG